MDNSTELERIGRREWLAASLLFVAAVLLRFPDLGRWGLAVDEFYFSKAVLFILENGMPRFPDGGYYSRGIALQYLATLPVSIFTDFEFAVRFLPALFGALTVPLLFLFARKHLPLAAAVFCGQLLLISSWHIEFSRFARMYTAFQLFFFMFLFFLYSGYWQERRSHQIFSWLTAWLAIFFHEASIFIPLILLLAFLQVKSLRSRKAGELLLVLAVLGLFNYLAHLVNYRRWGVTESLPPQFVPAKGGLPLLLPHFDLLAAAWSSGLFAAIFILLAIGGFLAIFRGGSYPKKPQTILLLMISFIFPLIHQFGILILLLTFIFLMKEGSFELFARKKRELLLYISGFFFFWLSSGFVLREQWFPDAGLGAVIVKMFSNLAHYPRFNDAIVAPFGKVMPVWSLIFFLVLGIAVIRNIYTRQFANGKINFPLLVFLLCFCAVPVFNTPELSTRYSFFFFPLAFVVAGEELLKGGNWLAARFHQKEPLVVSTAFILFFFTMLLTEDVNSDHLVNPADEKVNFRTGLYSRMDMHWYPRVDFETPAKLVNQSAGAKDIVVIDYSPFSFYIERPIINFVPLSLSRFNGISRKKGSEECWTGQPLIFAPEAIADLVPAHANGKMWLLLAQKSLDENSLQLLSRSSELEVRRVYTGICGRTEVWQLNRLSPSRASANEKESPLP